MKKNANHSDFLFILLGASNLARSYSAFKRHLSQNISEKKIQFINVLGPGRGYCGRGGFLNLSYPPIGQNKIFKAIGKQIHSGNKVVIIITDIGNDIMYGVDDNTLIGCLDSLIEKSLSWNAEIFITSIHVDISKDLGQRSFKFLRTFFYPGSPIVLKQADAAVKNVNQYLEEKSMHRDSVHLIDGLGKFCGMDKIHFSLLKSHLAWSHIASKIFEKLHIVPSSKLEIGSMFVSLLRNMNRLVFTDMMRIKKKDPEFY